MGDQYIKVGNHEFLLDWPTWDRVRTPHDIQYEIPTYTPAPWGGHNSNGYHAVEEVYYDFAMVPGQEWESVNIYDDATLEIPAGASVKHVVPAHRSTVIIHKGANVEHVTTSNVGCVVKYVD